MAAPQIKLTYFDGAGRAELVRLLFTLGGVEFEDERIQRDAFLALKPTLPLGQLPVLEVDGVVYAQSMAIARYAAKVAGLYPQDPVAALRADMICETINDLKNAFVAAVLRETDEALKAEKTKKFVEETAPKSLSVLESFVQGKFFAGDHATIADVHVVDALEIGLKARVSDFSTAAYPKLEGVIANVKANANVAAYLAKHQK